MTDLPSVETLELELAEGWLTIRLNQPHSRNALSAQMAAELRDVLVAVREDREVRGITLRGNGGTFCAGGDLRGFQAAFASADAHASIVELSTDAAGLFELVSTMPQVVVMAVEGAAMAGGFGLACCGDVVLTTKDTRFALTETRIGLTPAQIVPHVLRRLGPARGRRLLLVAETLGGEAAVERGVADAAYDDVAALDAGVQEVKRKVLRCAPGAVAATKALVFDELKGSFDVTRAAETFAGCLLSDEGSEGIASFLERRKPRWAPEG